MSDGVHFGFHESPVDRIGFREVVEDFGFSIPDFRRAELSIPDNADGVKSMSGGRWREVFRG